MKRNGPGVLMAERSNPGPAGARLILISGGNGSGKSLYAEELVSRTEGARFYVATMLPCTEDNHRRIEKHREQRRGLGFVTLECPRNVGSLSPSADGVVLLEDVSNLLANAMFEDGGDAQSVFEDILALAARCRLLVAVTISGLVDEGCDAETREYIRQLDRLNRMLHDRAVVAVAMRDRVPNIEKGDIHDCI